MKLVSVVFLLLLVPAWATAQEPVQPVAAEVSRSPEVVRRDPVAPPDASIWNNGDGTDVERTVWDDTDIVHGEPGWAKPIPGVDIIVRKKPGGTPSRTTTDANGAFAFANLEPGRYELELAQPREIPGATLKINVTPVNDAPSSIYNTTITYTGLEIAWSPRVDLRMEVTERGNGLAGRVTNDTTGRDCTGPPRSTPTQCVRPAHRGGWFIPLLAIVVRMEPDVPPDGPGSGAMFRTTTDANGTFSLANVTSGQYELQLTQPASIHGTEFVVTEAGFAINDKGPAKRCTPHVELTMVATERGNVLRGRISEDQTERATVTGRVTNAQGQPEACRVDNPLPEPGAGRETRNDPRP